MHLPPYSPVIIFNWGKDVGFQGEYEINKFVTYINAYMCVYIRVCVYKYIYFRSCESI